MDKAKVFVRTLNSLLLLSWSGGLMNLNLGLVNLDGNDMLVAGSRTGLLYGVSVSQVKGQESVVARRRSCHQTCF